MGPRAAGAACAALCAAALWACGARDASLPSCDEALAPVAEGFGARGPYTASVDTLPHPDRPGLVVSLHRPAERDGPVPLVVFAHANDVGDPAQYAGLIEHVVSRGSALLFAPYMTGTQRHTDRLAALWSGVRAALRAHAGRLDLTRVGLVGHSYGAGMLPFLARRMLVERGWGGSGAFLYLMAPWFAVDATPAQLAALPPHVAVLVQVYEDDTANDHRIAIDLFHALGGPDTRKDYVLVRSDRWRDCDLPAVHTVPQSAGLRARDDALDVRAVFRLLDALVAFAFAGDPQAGDIALGGGAPQQVEMGAWPDGTPVRPLVAGGDPRPVHPESHYLFRNGDAAGWLAYGR